MAPYNFGSCPTPLICLKALTTSDINGNETPGGDHIPIFGKDEATCEGLVGHTAIPGDLAHCVSDVAECSK